MSEASYILLLGNNNKNFVCVCDHDSNQTHSSILTDFAHRFSSVKSESILLMGNIAKTVSKCAYV